MVAFVIGVFAKTANGELLTDEPPGEASAADSVLVADLFGKAVPEQWFSREPPGDGGSIVVALLDVIPLGGAVLVAPKDILLTIEPS